MKGTSLEWCSCGADSAGEEGRSYMDKAGTLYLQITFINYMIHWICQAVGKGLESLSYISANCGSIRNVDSMEGGFNISRENDKNTLCLKMNGLRVDDTATCYCERDIVC
jgi:hypothetical protein